MDPWKNMRGWYSCADKAAFCDRARCDTRFGFPLPHTERVFSISLNENGCLKRNTLSTPVPTGYLGNAVAYRMIKEESQDAWIWDERYHFSRRISRILRIATAQREFAMLLGEKRLMEVHDLAIARGLDPRHKTGKRPDIAAFLPGRKPEWRFIEVKRVETGDLLHAKQERWLRLLAEVFGRESAILLTLDLAT
jgi:hypothetical protein